MLKKMKRKIEGNDSQILKYLTLTCIYSNK
jgi:hypothetical protein